MGAFTLKRLARFRHCAVLPIIFLPAIQFMFAQRVDVRELQNGWMLASTALIQDSGAAISQPSYKPVNWHKVRRMPATVLDVLQEDGTYPKLYYGMNLATEVPQDLWKEDWWYRTSFKVPRGNRTFWIDFPGINYRAEIWLNGRLVADNKKVIGMYVNHRFNVTQFIRPGWENVLAVKITPERLIQDVDGIELADSWFDALNWNYLGYHGPLDISRLIGVNASIPGLTASYEAPAGYAESAIVSAKATIAAATTEEVTYAATVTAGGAPVTAGTVTFLQGESILGSAEVNPDGMATLVVKGPYQDQGISYVPDRNAGIWKPVLLYTTGRVKLSDAYVETDLPLPDITSAKLTVYAEATNGSSGSVQGTLEGEITRPGKPAIRISQRVSLAKGETREIVFAPGDFPQLVVRNPDLWWPYTLGKPALYDLHLKFVANSQISDTESVRFGIRKVTQNRDQDEQFSDVGRGGNFYLQVNGKDFMVRGGYYMPDLLYRYDPGREATEIRYAKDLGLNMLRWEGKIPEEHMIDLADEAGIPVMLGWMCCNEWEHWAQWSTEDYRVAQESLRSQILMLRSHPAVFVWANGSDGRPPAPIRDDYHRILTDLHWQNAIVDTVSSFARGANGSRLWDGIHMQGPYTWRPPSYWFSDRYAAARGSCAEQGDNENVPPFEGLKKFIPTDKLWPIDELWSFHAGAHLGNNELLTAKLALSRRYGPSTNAQDFARKAQLGLYEDTRAQFEDFSANGWANHKMTIYFMMRAPWPTFYGHLYDNYLQPGGAYYGAKTGLRPLSVVFDYYATGNHSKANIRVVNQTVSNRTGLRVRVRIYDLLGQVRYDHTSDDISADAQGVALAMTLPVIPNLTPVYFVRCELFEGSKTKIVDNVYWQSTTLDDLGSPSNENPFELEMASWADMTPLNSMPPVPLEVSAEQTQAGRKSHVTIRLRNRSSHIAFFERAEITATRGGDEILPIEYDNNYVTVFPGETVEIHGNTEHSAGTANWIKLEGYNTVEETAPIQPPR